MQNSIEIENIEEMRRQEDIDDLELREEIRRLGIGDFVMVTLVNGSKSCETLAVQITSIRGRAFRGKLARRPVSSGLSKLRAGAAVAFTAAHIHSLRKGQPADAK